MKTRDPRLLQIALLGAFIVFQAMRHGWQPHSQNAWFNDFRRPLFVQRVFYTLDT